jgi:hypothetical protein
MLVLTRVSFHGKKLYVTCTKNEKNGNSYSYE